MTFPIFSSRHTNYNTAKRKKVTEALNDVLSTVLKHIEETSEHNCEILKQLKDKFNDPETKNDKKIQILTLAPQSWSINKVAAEFQTTRRKVELARKLVENHGILAHPNKKPGHRKISEIDQEIVIKFYEDDRNSRMMPGLKDFVSCKQPDGTRI